MREFLTGENQPTELETNIRNQVKLWRRQSGLSLADLARRSGLTYAKLYRLETGSGRLLARDLFALAQGLHIPIDSFFQPLQQHPPQSTVLEQDSRDFLELVQRLDCDKIRLSISGLIRTIANATSIPEANRR